jgi:integrase
VGSMRRKAPGVLHRTDAAKRWPLINEFRIKAEWIDAIGCHLIDIDRSRSAIGASNLRRYTISRAGEIGRGLTLYGLRHTVAVILRECGFDERAIADALGQKPIEMARHYAHGADLKPKMRGVVEAFERSVNERRTQIVKPS